MNSKNTELIENCNWNKELFFYYFVQNIILRKVNNNSQGTITDFWGNGEMSKCAGWDEALWGNWLFIGVNKTVWFFDKASYWYET